MGEELLGGRYRLEEVLGRGGMATVWRARDTRLDRPVAVKMLNRGELREPSAAARFDREARTVARLTHPNIVSVYDVGTEDGTGFIVMELVDGQTVASMLDHGPLPIDRATSIAEQTADALSAAHAIGIIHRDIKPANIMVTPDGEVKVCDFGIARELQADEVTLTAPDTAIGTASYMAPEQAEGKAVDARTDLYALGCVLYAMLAGHPPFTGDRPIEVLYQQLHNTPAPLRTQRPEVPPALEALVSRLLAKDPADRPADAAAVRAALDDPTMPVRTGARGAAGAVAGAAGAVGPGTTRPLAPAAMARAAVPVPIPVRPGPDDEPPWYPAEPVRRDRGILGPVLVALVLVALLIGAAFVITALLDRQHSTPQTAPQRSTKPAPTTPAPKTTSSPPPSPTAAPSTTAPSTAAPSTGSDPVDGVRSVLQQIVAAGQIDPGAADDLNGKLDDIDKAVADGKTGDAQHKIREMKNDLGKLVDDGKLSEPGNIALTSALDALAASLPASDGGD